jgi:hypothetical protein
MARKPNTTQRSWSDYKGDDPIERLKYSDYYDESSRWSYGARKREIEKDKANSPPEPETAPAPKTTGAKGEKRSSKEPPKGYVYNRFGYLEPEEWYNKDEKSGALTKKKSYEYTPKKTSRADGYISSSYGSGYSRQPLGFTGSPISFTAAGPRAGMGPTPTALSTPPPFPELPNYSSLMGFGGYPMFPYANY